MMNWACGVSFWCRGCGTHTLPSLDVRESVGQLERDGWFFDGQFPSMDLTVYCPKCRPARAPKERPVFKPNTITILNGNSIAFENVDMDLVDIESLAHSLAQFPRFGGHQREFVSVAEHSVMVAEVMERELGRPDIAFEGLIHDLHETLSGGDIPRPYKRSPFFAAVPVLEMRVSEKIRARFGLPNELSELVHTADMMVFAAECNQNTNDGPHAGFHKPCPAANIQLRYWPWKEAKARFLAEFERLGQLYGKRGIDNGQ